MENKEPELNKEYRLDDESVEQAAGGIIRIPGSGRPFDDKSKENTCCPKCGRYQQAAVCRNVEGRGPVLVIT